MIYFCCEQLRREAVRKTAGVNGQLNGIDYLEVLDHDAPTPAEQQRKLLVHFINDKHLAELSATGIRITGGERIRMVQVVNAAVDPNDPPHVLTVEVDQPGDFSVYSLSLVDPDREKFDPMLSEVAFSFKVQCPSEFDCQTLAVCPPEDLPEPDINYLARDYASFRRLLLDRMAQLMPQWQARSPADAGVALVELLAYVGDHLSYQQDAVATEAYLGTCRQRVSARRHARLVDYRMHDGCNSRAWVHFHVAADNVSIPRGTQLLAAVTNHDAATIAPQSRDLEKAMNQRPVVFETVSDATFFKSHNEIEFYTWSDAECCLPKGATAATLSGNLPDLNRGGVLIFEEVRGPQTGIDGDANPALRHAVRVTRVVSDIAGESLTDPQTGEPVTQIEWRPADALPFPLCISSRTAGEEPVSVARGNIVLVDHGLTIADEPLGAVPEPTLFELPTNPDRCQRVDPVPIVRRYRPRLSAGPLTQAADYPDPVSPDAFRPASEDITQSLGDVNPVVHLKRIPAGQQQPASDSWEVKRDLFNSGSFDPHFVVETENDGTGRIRLGNDQHGLRPDSGDSFLATYRVGNGRSGNVGAESITHVVTIESDIVLVRNPLAAHGGVDPESLAEVRRNAPQAFRRQERAVTPADYARVTERQRGVQKAAATFRWTGSWHTVFVTTDRFGGLNVGDEFESNVRQHLERFRMAGYDLEVDGPRYVPLEIQMEVCVQRDYFRSEVKAALLEVFHNRDLPNGQRGVFHPDNFTFGQPVHLSPLYAAAQAVDGVASVVIIKFQRQGTPDKTPLEVGCLEPGRLQIARLDNDPNYPERGMFSLIMKGGK